MILISKPSFLALVCAVALVGILISPAVPSPPTVVGKVIRTFTVPPAVAILSPAGVVGVIMLGQVYRTFHTVVNSAGSAAGPGSLPLRR